MQVTCSLPSRQLTGLLRRGCGMVRRLCSRRRISSTSATRLFPPLVGAQYTRLLSASPHSRAAACQGYMVRTPLASKACRGQAGAGAMIHGHGRWGGRVQNAQHPLTAAKAGRAGVGQQGHEAAPPTCTTPGGRPQSDSRSRSGCLGAACRCAPAGGCGGPAAGRPPQPECCGWGRGSRCCCCWC